MSAAEESQDEVLEKMLMEAQRLALRMRSSTTSLDASNRSLCEQDEDANILSCDSDSHADPGEDHGSQRVSLQSYLDRINQQASEESKETMSSGCEEKSYTSVASAQLEAIDSAVKAAREMELTLRSLHPESNISPPASPASRSRSAEKNRATRRMSGSPNNSRMMEDELNTSSSHISWERVDPVHEDDADYAPIVDYTTPKKKPIPRDDSEIKWEKITSPSKNEDDYVPIADYSRAPRRSTMNVIRGSILQSKSRWNGSTRSSSSWRMSRRRRRKAMRAAAVVLAVSSLSYFIVFRESAPSGSGSVDSSPLDGQVVVNVTQLAAVMPMESTANEAFNNQSSTREESGPIVMEIEEFEGILFGSTCAIEELMEVQELTSHEDITEAVELEATEKLEEQRGTDDQNGDCGLGRRCSKRNRQKLFSQENIEALLASMLQ